MTGPPGPVARPPRRERVRATGRTAISPLRLWAMAARPRTLHAAVAPVLVGTAAAIWAGTVTPEVGMPDAVTGDFFEVSYPTVHVGAFLAALLGSIFIQIGTNLANDYSDARRGADTAERLGPVRVTASGLVAPQRVLVAVWIAFAMAVAAGLFLVITVGWEILVVGIASIAAGVLYTGGPKPYGYAGLGEFFVFVFFGLVAVNGSYYVQTEQLDALAFGLSIPVGLLATAILVANNIRDIDTDRRAGKRTLAVRMGRRLTGQLYVTLLVVPFVVLPSILLMADGPAWGLLAILAAPLAISPARTVLGRTDGPALNGALAATGALLGVFSLLLTVGLLIA
ncbi:MAG: 1,4-dihydroxy-2-naphthoate polyprenyltransferase [Solirubrobacterales bacterium]